MRFRTWILLATPLVPASASAQGPGFEDPSAVPSAPRPPTLPELTHSGIEVTLETTAGTLLPAVAASPAGFGRGDRSHAYVQRFGLEVPLGLRRWFFGATYEVAGGGGRALKLVGGNFAMEGRTVWATTTGLAFGGGLALTLPTARFDSASAAAQVALDAATLRPWDTGLFLPDVVGVRPFVDVRAIDGPFVVQFREGLDVLVSTDSFPHRSVYAIAGFYLGWRVTRFVAGGVEVFEAYAIDAAGVRDGTRAAVVVSPSVRLSLPWVQPAISMFTDVGPPLNGAHDSVWGFRLAITLVYDRRVFLRFPASPGSSASGR